MPVTIAGKRYWMQLDTGADRTILYARPEDVAHRFGYTIESSAGHESVCVPKVGLGGRVLNAKRFFFMPAMSDGQSLSGTIGIDALIGYVVVLDLPARRFCLVQPDDFPMALLSAFAGASGSLAGGKFLFSPVVDGRPLEKFAFDTGSSAAGLSVVHKIVWAELTGRDPNDPVVRHLTIPAWGRQLVSVYAPARGAASISAISLGKPAIWYTLDDPVLSDTPETDSVMSGVIGLASFLDDIVLLKLDAQPALGVFHITRGLDRARRNR